MFGLLAKLLKLCCKEGSADFASVTSWAALHLGTGDDVAFIEAFLLGGPSRCSVGAETLGALIVDAPPRLAVRGVGDDFCWPLRAG